VTTFREKIICKKNPKILYKKAGPRAKTKTQLFSFAWSLDTGVDYNSLFQEPFKRYKFYHSFKEDADPVKMQSYMQEVYERCKENNISLQVKTEDHRYDTCIFYTWHFDELKQIIQKIYPKYARGSGNIFFSCPRVHQRSIKGINPNHIACAQEPAVVFGLEKKTEKKANKKRNIFYINKNMGLTVILAEWVI